MHKIGVIVRKEWSEVFKNRLVLGTVGFMPLMLTALPLVLLRVMGTSGDWAKRAPRICRRRLRGCARG